MLSLAPRFLLLGSICLCSAAVQDDRFKDAEKACGEERYLDAVEIWETIKKEYGTSHEAGKKADECIEALHDDPVKGNRLKAQELLKKAEEAREAKKNFVARGLAQRILRQYKDLPEAKTAADFLEKMSPGSTKSKSKKKSKAWPFGTVTRKLRTPGDLDTKGTCNRLDQGGYLKFDITKHAGKTIRNASVKVYVRSWSRNQWRWLTHLTMDPTEAPPKDVFAAIEKHQPVISGVITLRDPDGWITVRLKKNGIDLINEALKKGQKWFAIGFAFE